MSDRLDSMQRRLLDALHNRGTPGDWRHISRQVGMYSFTALNPDQVAFIAKEYHIYLSSDGRVNIAGRGSNTVPRLADAIYAAVTRGV